MKDQALQIARSQEQEIDKLNHLREYLQHVILREMFEVNWLQELIYHGGTALRMIYDFLRFSEDLDFHIVRPNFNYEMTHQLRFLIVSLNKNGYEVEQKYSLVGNVRSVMLKFNKLLFEAGISPHKNQKLNIKLEIDTSPPLGFHTKTKTINRYFPFVVVHHDLPSFFAGKLHAVLQRNFVKGRDYYDLNFFLSRWANISPNMTYLNNALKQTGYKGQKVEEENWKQLIAHQVEKIDWNLVQQDLEPFLLRQGDIKAFQKEFLLKQLCV